MRKSNVVPIRSTRKPPTAKVVSEIPLCTLRKLEARAKANNVPVGEVVSGLVEQATVNWWAATA
ncbi:hypothetical protein [Pseudomarimonas arenosa]|uniref:CopG-like ribbon-helix-helix domain-containing protein n=1 Tax=Pseudomarimonas arenosa TaxID=2774145 RepID=A0AAW3ZDK8_9GAMM|nr:hypothetical protein [Pseudomarimonas arenosa]MBD8524138.1 hypothetical protein [Pseudomarimonas arenosa]